MTKIASYKILCPQSTLRFTAWLEGLPELREAAIPTITICYREKREIKVSQSKQHTDLSSRGQARASTCPRPGELYEE